MERLVLPGDSLEKLHPLDRYFQVCDQTGRVLATLPPGGGPTLGIAAE